MTSDALKEHVRLTILRLLDEMPSGFCQAGLLTEGLRYLDLDVNRAFVVHELRWLEERGLVTLREHDMSGIPMADIPFEGIIRATITDAGTEVARQRQSVKGVRVPGRSDLSSLQSSSGPEEE